MVKKIKKSNILIIGGTGFIGYHLANRCKKLGWSVTSFSKNKPKKNRKIKNIKYLHGDLSIKKDLKKIDKNFDYVVNLGGYVDHKNKTKNYKTHYLGCKNLVKIFLEKKLKLFLQVGSGAEYEKIASPHKEDDVCKPNSIYGKPKFLATNFLIKQHNKKDFPCCIVRLYQVFGEKQESNRIIPFIIRACLSNKSFPCSEGQQYRDFIHIEQIIDAFIKILKSNYTKGEIINIGSGKLIKIRELINKIRKIANRGKPEFGKIPMRRDEMIKFFPNINKIKKLVRWSPKNNFENKLKLIIEYEKKNFDINKNI